MSKQEFLVLLRKGLSGLPQQDVEERLNFYSEMIDDRIEEGFSEEDAVGEIGSADAIISQIIADVPFLKMAKERIKPKRRLKTWEIVLIALGFPIWFSLGVSALAVVLSLYVSLWAVIISLWSVFVSLVACALGGTASCVIFAVGGNGISGLFMLAMGIVCAGLSIFAFYGCKAITKGALALTKKIALWTKNCFIKKGEV